MIRIHKSSLTMSRTTTRPEQMRIGMLNGRFKSLAILAISGFMVMFAVTALGHMPTAVVSALTPWKRPVDDRYTPSYRRGGGDELVMVYLGAASCGWSNAEGMPELIEKIKRYGLA